MSVLDWLFLMPAAKPFFLDPLALWRLTSLESSLYIDFLVFTTYSPKCWPIALALGDMLVGPKGAALRALGTRGKRQARSTPTTRKDG
jgi:hypothetical protein